MIIDQWQSEPITNFQQWQRQTINTWFPCASSPKSSGRTVNQIDSQRTDRNSKERVGKTERTIFVSWFGLQIKSHFYGVCPDITPFPTILSAYYLTRVIPTEQVRLCVRTSQCPYANKCHSLFTLSDGACVCGTVLSFCPFCPVFPAGISLYKAWLHYLMQPQSPQTLHMVRTLGLNPCLSSVWNLLFALIKTVKYCPQLWLYDTQTRCSDIKSGHRSSCSESLWPEANI